MALATRCPKCDAIFRVVADQLKLRGGLVRCGACREVFDAIGSLSYVEDSALAAAAPVVPKPKVTTAPPTLVLSADDLTPVNQSALLTQSDMGRLPSAQPTPVGEKNVLPPVAAPATTLSSAAKRSPQEPFATRETATAPKVAIDPLDALDPLTITDELLPSVHARASQPMPPAPSPSPAAEPHRAALGTRSLEMRAEKPMAQPLPVAHSASERAPARAEPPARDPRPSRRLEKKRQLRIESEDVAEPLSAVTRVKENVKRLFAARKNKLAFGPTELFAAATRLTGIAETTHHSSGEPTFLNHGSPRGSGGFSVLFGGGSIVLTLVLLAQLLILFRADLVTRWPSWRPTLVTLCHVAHCNVGWPTAPTALVVVGSDLQAIPGTDVLELTAVIRNRANYGVALPAIELALTDTQSRPVARKVFAPIDYLATSGDAPHRPEEALEAGADLNIRIAFEARGITATGFVVYPFYF